MALVVARLLQFGSLDELAPAQRARLPIVQKTLCGEELSPEECWSWDDFGASARVWQFEEDGNLRYEMWDGSGGTDAVLIDIHTDQPAAILLEHHLQNAGTDPVRFAAIEAAWDQRAQAEGAGSADDA
jgi:hypothetical protein